MEKFRIPAIVLEICLLSLLMANANGYLFKCVDNCDCETDDTAIHCHRNRSRETLNLPEKPLHGFNIIGLTNNNLKYLPSEDDLLKTFPDLQAVDIECNPNFDCTTLENYKHLTIMSDCGKNITNSEHCDNFPTDAGLPTEDCDLECQTKRYYKKLHQYIIKLWELLKRKLRQFREENGWVGDVENFFKDIGNKVSTFVKENFSDDK